MEGLSEKFYSLTRTSTDSSRTKTMIIKPLPPWLSPIMSPSCLKPSNLLPPSNPMQAFRSRQSWHLNWSEMIRKAGIMPTVFELAKKSQTYCQKEERFTVQNKLTDGSPIREQPRKARLSIRHKLLCAMKNGQVCKTRKRAVAIEMDLRFVGQRKTLTNRSDNIHPKSKTSHAR